MPIRFDILTLFPEAIEGIIKSSILKRAIEKKIIEVNIINFREYSTNKHSTVDDYAYGGGAGMLISVEPVHLAMKDIPGLDSAYKILTSPSGNVYSQKKAEELSQNATTKEQTMKKTLTELELQKELVEKKLLEEKTLYKERMEEEQRKYERLDTAYSRLQSSEAEGKAMLSSFMKECEKRKDENTELQEKLNLAETKLTETVSKNKLLVETLQKEKKQAEEKLYRTELELVREKQHFEEEVTRWNVALEQERKTKEIEWRLELQIQENHLKEQHKQELDELRKELDKYKELYYQKQHV